MPKPRDYKRESLLEGPQRRKARAERKKARRMMERQLTAKYGASQAHKMLEGKDVDHKKAIGNGGKTVMSNLRLRDPSANRADKRGLFTGKRTTRPKNPLKD